MKIQNIKLIFLPLSVLLLTSTLLASNDNTLTQSILSTLAGAFFSGVLLTFTPCVLPMMPIVSSIIAGQGKDISKSKAVSLSLSYVLGTAVSYAVMGALAGATGEQLQSYFQNVYFIGSISFIFVIMALSMFGLFSIALPSFIQTRLNSESQGIKGGSLVGVFVLGMITALILGACVSPVLISFLSVAISTGDAILGAITMFSLALGMGVPLVLIGFGAGHLLPRAGEWMDKIKYIFGVLLLGVAIYIFNTLDILPILIVWGAFFVGISIYLGATQSLSHEASGWDKLIKSSATLLLIWGVFLLIGGAYGGKDMLQPLAKLSLSQSQTNKNPDAKPSFIFETVQSLDELTLKQEEAREEDKLLVIYFYTDTCPVCKKLKATTLIDPDVVAELEENYITLKVNMSSKGDIQSQEIKEMFNIFGPPAFVFFDKDGEESKTSYGYQDQEEFLDTLELVGEDDE
ncbi:MAG: thiol:disulfide interchange protein DsbD [Sulfurimonas sp.]|jgi:thiol:disulfide interchange protein DsbD|uniref:protein-disulfide reductase DsbD family protein n=1 Tax=Sulfurimonas sp. TaxID=2022749 RepID=UPI0039E31451